MIRTAVTAAAVLLLAACNQPSPSPSPSASSSPSASPSPSPSGSGSPSPSPSPSPATDGKTIPAAFQGEWMQNTDACAAGTSETRLRISADQLLFHESSGPVTSVVAASASDITVHAAISGEGEGPNDTTFHFTLSADGQTLTDVGNAFARQRCPSN